MLTLSVVLEALTGAPHPEAGQVITEAVIDSRQAIPGSMFIALPGERVDGHDFVGAAFEKGAYVALIEHPVTGSYPIVDLRERATVSEIPGVPICLQVESSLDALQRLAGYWRRLQNVKVIGITGSVGKSTTKELIAEVLEQRFCTFKNPGNLNNEIGLPLSLLQLSAGHEIAVLEMGFYMPGEIALLCELARPQIGIVTNIGTVHAERAGSQEAIARGKSELVQALPPAPDGVVILNYDDPWVRAMAQSTQAQVVYYGLDPAADLWADEIEGLGLEGVRFRLHYRKEVLHLRVPMIGRHSVHTALRAAAVGLVTGLSWQDIITGLRGRHTQLRLVAVRTPSGALLLDDTYNASPESTLAALNLLEELQGRRIAVLGDMLELGVYETHGHAMVGTRAAEVANLLVTVGERAVTIAQAAREAGFQRAAIAEFETSEQAIEFLLPLLQAEDVVLVKGSRAMNLDRIVAALEAGL